MLYTETIAVCCKDHMQYINTLLGKNRVASAAPCNTVQQTVGCRELISAQK
jgi:hypothetical protein